MFSALVRTVFRLALLLFPLACFGFADRANAQCVPQWVFGPDQGLPGLNGAVWCSLPWDPDGNGPMPQLLVVGGTFSIAGEAVTRNVAAWDGSSWHALGQIGDSNSTIYALAQLNGELFAGGSFESLNGAPANSIARWDGVTWQPLGLGVQTTEPSPGLVYALTAHQGRLIVGGNFRLAGGAAAECLAAWNGSSWETIAPAVTSGIIYALSSTGPDLIVGGRFTSIGGLNANAIAIWNGSAWSALGGGLAGSSQASVRALTYFQNQLVAGGTFTTADGVRANRLATWNGSSWSPTILVGPTTIQNGTNGDVYSICIHDNKLAVAGLFNTAGAKAASRSFFWDGTTVTPIGTGQSGTGRTVASWNGSFYVGGSFLKTGTLATLFMARWDGAAWNTLGTGFDERIDAFGVYGSDLYASGRFTHAGSSITPTIAKWNGATWSPVGTGFANPSGAISDALAFVEYQGELVAGGIFRSVDGVAADSIARWNGAVWKPLGSGLVDGSGSIGVANAMCIFEDRLIVAGGFVSAGGVPANSIVSWDGTTWRALGAGQPSFIRALAIYQGQLIAGGSQYGLYGSFDGATLARWDGTSWSTLGAPLNPGSPGGVYALDVYEGELFAGGKFARAGAVPVTPGIARWNGSAWNPVGAGLGASAEVRSLRTYKDSLYVGGIFPKASGAPSTNVAMWRTDYHGSGTWRPLGAGVDGIIAAFQPFNNELVLGGQFNKADDRASVNWARWFACSECRADLNGDGYVNDEDMVIFAEQYDVMFCPDAGMLVGCPADLDNDNQVDDRDFVIFSHAFDEMICP